MNHFIEICGNLFNINNIVAIRPNYNIPHVTDIVAVGEADNYFVVNMPYEKVKKIIENKYKGGVE